MVFESVAQKSAFLSVNAKSAENSHNRTPSLVFLSQVVGVENKKPAKTTADPGNWSFQPKPVQIQYKPTQPNETLASNTTRLY